MMPGPTPGAGQPGWRFDSGTGYYLNPSTGVYFDPQRGAYGVDGRWISGAEYTAMYGRAPSMPQGGPAAPSKHNNRYVAHPALSRGGVGDASTGIGAPQQQSTHHPQTMPPMKASCPRTVATRTPPRASAGSRRACDAAREEETTRARPIHRHHPAPRAPGRRTRPSSHHPSVEPRNRQRWASPPNAATSRNAANS